MLTKDPLHLFTLFDLIDIFSLESINARIELKKVQETFAVKNWIINIYHPPRADEAAWNISLSSWHCLINLTVGTIMGHITTSFYNILKAAIAFSNSQ